MYSSEDNGRMLSDYQRNHIDQSAVKVSLILWGSQEVISSQNRVGASALLTYNDSTARPPCRASHNNYTRLDPGITISTVVAESKYHQSHKDL